MICNCSRPTAHPSLSRRGRIFLLVETTSKREPQARPCGSACWWSCCGPYSGHYLPSASCRPRALLAEAGVLPDAATSRWTCYEACQMIRYVSIATRLTPRRQVPKIISAQGNRVGLCGDATRQGIPEPRIPYGLAFLASAMAAWISSSHWAVVLGRGRGFFTCSS